MDYFEDAYGFARVQSLILTAKEGKTLASKEAFSGDGRLEKWFVLVECDHVVAKYSGKVKYENLCYKVVDTADETPCFQKWLDSGSVETDILGCTLDVTANDCSCVNSFTITSVTSYGCIPKVAQINPLRAAKVSWSHFPRTRARNILFQINPSAASIGSLVLESCQLPAIDMGTSSCNLQPDGTTKYLQRIHQVHGLDSDRVSSYHGRCRIDRGVQRFR